MLLNDYPFFLVKNKEKVGECDFNMLYNGGQAAT